MLGIVECRVAARVRGDPYADQAPLKMPFANSARCLRPSHHVAVQSERTTSFTGSTHKAVPDAPTWNNVAGL